MKSIVRDGQQYRAISEKPYIRNDGNVATLVYWQTACPECGDVFVITSGKNNFPKHPRRRCDKHKRPGKPVNRKRKEGNRKKLTDKTLGKRTTAHSRQEDHRRPDHT